MWIMYLLFAIILANCYEASIQNSFSKLKGDYLGQSLSGIKPEIFAPKIISTGIYEILQLVSLSLFDRIPIREFFTKDKY